MSKLDRIWPAPRFRRNGAHGLVGGSKRALRVSGHGECPLARSEDKMATRKLEEAWAVLDYGAPR